MARSETFDGTRAHAAAAIALALLALCGSVARSAASDPVEAVDGAALGRAYAPELATTYADAWEEAARAIEQGKSVGEAETKLQEAWKAARVKAFKERVQPAFSLVLAEGAEPSDPAHRVRVAGLWREFARGLKGGR